MTHPSLGAHPTLPPQGGYDPVYLSQRIVCGLQSAACSLRPAVCGLQSAACSLRPAVCGLQSAACSLRPALRALAGIRVKSCESLPWSVTSCSEFVGPNRFWLIAIFNSAVWVTTVVTSTAEDSDLPKPVRTNKLRARDERP
ncbi:hypothetical protein AAG570_008506 [Ranatra chinensis]|uniref:Uncharacterized protein n=1 Tax=Ranatra chinensis TaxID=642074 RepID=A0ABD0Z403_9HEMI